MRISHPRHTLVSLPLVLALAACASAGGGNRPAGATPDRIVQAELTELQDLDAYDAVRQLRPGWLRVRSGAEPPVIYLNNTRFGNDPSTLRSLQAGGIQEMEYLSATDAQTRFGLGHTGGAIVVTQLGR